MRRVKEGIGSFANVSAAFSLAGPILPGNPGSNAGFDLCFGPYRTRFPVAQGVEDLQVWTRYDPRRVPRKGQLKSGETGSPLEADRGTGE